MTRPRRVRSTVRVLLQDPSGALLLFHAFDPGNGVDWWETPGGGVDPGEDATGTAVRELREETGLRISAADVVGPLGHRDVLHGYSDVIVDQQDTFVAVRTPMFEIDTSGFNEQEKAMTLGSQWWSTADLADTEERIWPHDLLDLVALLDHPDRWPVALAPAEEPSVPVTRGG